MWSGSPLSLAKSRGEWLWKRWPTTRSTASFSGAGRPNPHESRKPREDLVLGRREDAIEPTENGHGQHDPLLLRRYGPRKRSSIRQRRLAITPCVLMRWASAATSRRSAGSGSSARYRWRLCETASVFRPSAPGSGPPGRACRALTWRSGGTPPTARWSSRPWATLGGLRPPSRANATGSNPTRYYRFVQTAQGIGWRRMAAPDQRGPAHRKRAGDRDA